MKKAKIIINKILHPPAGVIIILPVIAFAGGDLRLCLR